MSWTTPDVDSTELINEILNQDTKLQYVETNQEILRDQAESFYKDIIEGIDPNATATFVFGDDAGAPE